MKFKIMTILMVGLLVVSSVASVFAEEKIVLTFAGYHGYEESGYDRIEALFEAENPNIDIKPVWNPDRYEDRMRTMIAGGNAPDIIEINDNYVQAYAANGYLISLDEYLADSHINPDDYVDVVFDFPIRDGKQYAWVLGSYPRTFCINVDLFKEAGVELPPHDKWDVEGWTWDDMIAAAKKLTKDTDGDGRIDQWGVSMAHEGGAIETVARNNGGPGVYSENGQEFSLADPAGYEGVQKLADLTLVHNVQPPVSLLRTFPAPDMFGQGKLAMIFAPIFETAQFRRDLEDEWIYAPVPKMEDRVIEGSILTVGIPPNSKHPEEAFKFLEFLLSDKAQSVFSEVGYTLPVRKGAEQFFIQPDKMPLNQELALDAMNYIKARNWSQYSERARSIFRPQFDIVKTGEKTAEEVFKSIEEEIEAILSGKRR